MASTCFVVTIRATSITVSNGEEAMYLLTTLVDMLTYEDEFAEDTKTLGFMYDKETDTLFLHKGVDIEYLQRCLGNVRVVYDLYHPYKPMKFEYEEIIAPRNEEQVDVIDFITGQGYHDNGNASQIFLVKDPGFGKLEPYSRKIPAVTTHVVKSTVLQAGGYVDIEHEDCGSGYIRMGDLKIGDYVFDKHGKPTQVIGIFEHGEQNIYELTFEDGRIAQCGLDHLWAVYIDDKIKYSVHDTKDLIDLINTHELYIPMCEPVQYKKKPYVVACFGPHITPTLDSLHGTYVNSSPEMMHDFLRMKGFVGTCGCVHVELINDEETRFYVNEVALPILYAMGYSAYYNNEDKGLYYEKKEKLKIVDIRYSHIEKARCIKVDNPDHLYLTEGFIVTHNTFCSGVGLCKLKMKTLIIMHRDALRKQWMNSLFNMNGLTSKEVHEIDSSEELDAIARGKIHLDYDVYLMTHATFRAGVNRIQKLRYVMNITKNLGIGLKIIDEAHLEFRDTLIMDFCFNVKRNLYLTATAGRSGKDENSIFRHVFSDAVFYKPSVLLTSNAPKKWVNYTTVEVNTHCKPNIYKFRVAGGKGMNPASYGKWVIQYDKKNTHFKCLQDLIKIAYEKDPYAKIIIFLPLIDLCEECVYFLKTHLDRDRDFQYDLDIRTICSKNSKKDNEYAKKSDIIVTTIQSCGTGTDIKGITAIISCSPYVSKITAQQVFGRIRYMGKIGDYYDIYDSSVPMDKFWLKSRYKTFKHLALNVRHISWTDDEENNNDGP